MQALVERIARRALRGAGLTVVPVDPHNLQAHIVYPDGRLGRLKERGEGAAQMGLVATAASRRSLDDPKFSAAIAAAIEQDPHTSVSDFVLRVYYEIMFFGLARQAQGDAIAVGVSYGKSVRAIFEYFDGIGDRTFFLVDPWSKADARGDNGHTFCHSAADVLHRLGRWHNQVRIVEGFAPEALEETGAGPLAYININVGPPDVELRSFERLFPRLSAGGVAILPGFAWQGESAAEDAWIKLAARFGQQAIWLPTGQGVIIKR